MRFRRLELQEAGKMYRFPLKLIRELDIPRSEPVSELKKGFHDSFELS